MKWLKMLGMAFLTMIFGMIGGQAEKGVRRYGIPGLALTLAFEGGFKLKEAVFFLLIPTLVMGYGQNSWLMDRLGSDTLVRAVYAILLTIPFWFYGIKRGLTSLILFSVAFQIHAGKLFTAGTFDVLIEDILRYGALGLMIGWCVFNDRKVKIE